MLAWRPFQDPCKLNVGAARGRSPRPTPSQRVSCWPSGLVGVLSDLYWRSWWRLRMGWWAGDDGSRGLQNPQGLDPDTE